MNRKLGIFETAQTISGEYLPFNAVAVLRLAGSPEPELVQRSLLALQDRHPMLKMRIRKYKSRYLFDSEGAPEIRLSVQNRDEEDRWQSACEEELNEKFVIDPGPLFRCRYLYSDRSPGEADIVLTFHHAIIDATSIECLSRELLTLCDSFRVGAPLPNYAPLPLLKPEEDYFPAAFKGFSRKTRIMRFMSKAMGEEMGYRRNMRGKRKPPIHEKARCRILPLQLSPEHTDKLVRQSRRQKVTLNSCLSAAMMVSVVRNLYDNQDLPVRYFIFADLRPYLKPPVEGNNLGSFHAMMRLSIPVSRDQDFWDLARRVNQQVYMASKTGEKFIQPLLSTKMMRMFIRLKNIRMGTTALSYPGVFNIEPVYGETKVRAVHGFVSNFPIGPEFTATARIFDRALWLDCVYLDSDMDRSKARSIADEMLAILQTG